MVKIPDPADGVSFVYTNYKGETARRNVVPFSVEFSSNEWYPEPTWLLRAWDLDRKDWRDFALLKIKFWEEDPRLKTSCAQCGHRIWKHYTVVDSNGDPWGGCHDHHYSGSLESKCYCEGLS